MGGEGLGACGLGENWGNREGCVWSVMGEQKGTGVPLPSVCVPTLPPATDARPCLRS